MIVANPTALSELYDTDETRWLDEMALRIREVRLAECDFPHLAEYLEDMAKRDRREVKSRLVVLLSHLVKWHAQPDKRSRSWLLNIDEQQLELKDLLSSGTLRRLAEDEWGSIVESARRRATIDTGLPLEMTLDIINYSLDRVLEVRLQADLGDVG